MTEDTARRAAIAAASAERAAAKPSPELADLLRRVTAYADRHTRTLEARDGLAAALRRAVWS